MTHGKQEMHMHFLNSSYYHMVPAIFYCGTCHVTVYVGEDESLDKYGGYTYSSAWPNVWHELNY